jgi:hypothetical protein
MLAVGKESRRRPPRRDSAGAPRRILGRGRAGIAGPDATADENASSDRMKRPAHSGALIE